MLVGLIGGQEVGVLRVPVVHAGNVHPGGKQIRSASKPERGEVAAIATAPEPDAAGVHVRPGAKIDACALDIIELAGAHRPVIESFAKIEAVANSAAIVYGEHDVAAAREVLIQRVSIAVVEHVVPAEEHLAARTTVEEHNGGMAGRFARIRREEELAVNLHAVSGGENHLLRSDQSAGRMGDWASEWSTRTVRLSLAITGAVSMPLPVVTAARRSPEGETRQTWRRSMSSWFEEKITSSRFALIETNSTSKFPGVSSLAVAPLAETEYRCNQPSRSQGKTIWPRAPQSN